jgi:tetratricopeptide (TPR) repeat protein
MDAIRPKAEPLALEPMEVSTAAAADAAAAAPAADGTATPPAGDRELLMTAADPFLASAVKEYQEGRIDPTLWARASAQSDDQSLVIAAYLRARATALQLKKRDRRRERRARRASEGQETRDRKVEPEPRSEVPATGIAGVRLRGVHFTPKHMAAAAAALASVVAAVWFMASPPQSDSVAPVSAVNLPATQPAPASPVAGAQPVVASTSGGASEGDSVHEVKVTVQQLKDAGNWNVLVLYAAKWTRDEPNNATAWNDLSIGYSKLHQYNDALLAATKAAELSPEDASLWRNLGHLNLNLDRLPEAGSAFERALAANSDDADALCGAALVAHKLGRTKDADAIARRVKSADGSCQGLSDGESVTVVVGRTAATKPASSARH